MDYKRETERLGRHIRLLEELITSNNLTPPPIKANFLDAADIIFNIVCKICTVKPGEIMMKSRGEQHVAFARQLIMYFCVEHKVGSQKYIAKHVNRTDHSTVHYGHNKVKCLISMPGICKDQHDLCKEKIDEALGLMEVAAQAVDFQI